MGDDEREYLEFLVDRLNAKYGRKHVMSEAQATAKLSELVAKGNRCATAGVRDAAMAGAPPGIKRNRVWTDGATYGGRNIQESGDPAHFWEVQG